MLSSMFRNYVKLLQKRKSADNSTHHVLNKEGKGKVFEKTYDAIVIGNASETAQTGVYKTRKI